MIPADWMIEYAVRPSSEQTYALRLERLRQKDKANLWVHFGGLGLDAEESAPWWIAKEPDTAPDPRQISVDEADAIYSALVNAKIGPTPSGETGLDGTTYELVMTAGFSKLALQWWRGLPPQWAALQRLVDNLESYIDNAKDSASQ